MFSTKKTLHFLGAVFTLLSFSSTLSHADPFSRLWRIYWKNASRAPTVSDFKITSQSTRYFAGRYYNELSSSKPQGILLVVRDASSENHGPLFGGDFAELEAGLVIDPESTAFDSIEDETLTLPTIATYPLKPQSESNPNEACFTAKRAKYCLRINKGTLLLREKTGGSIDSGVAYFFISR